jgi:hypothetical protein
MLQNMLNHINQCVFTVQSVGLTRQKFTQNSIHQKLRNLPFFQLKNFIFNFHSYTSDHFFQSFAHVLAGKISSSTQCWSNRPRPLSSVRTPIRQYFPEHTRVPLPQVFWREFKRIEI